MSGPRRLTGSSACDQRSTDRKGATSVDGVLRVLTVGHAQDELQQTINASVTYAGPDDIAAVAQLVVSQVTERGLQDRELLVDWLPNAGDRGLAHRRLGRRGEGRQRCGEQGAPPDPKRKRPRGTSSKPGGLHSTEAGRQLVSHAVDVMPRVAAHGAQLILKGSLLGTEAVEPDAARCGHD